MTSKRELKRSIKRLIRDAEASGFHITYQDHDFKHTILKVKTTLDNGLRVIKAKPCHPAYYCSYTHYGHTYVKIHGEQCPLT